MAFNNQFLLDTLTAVLFLLLFNGLPGYLYLSLFLNRRLACVEMLCTPLFGACLLGPLTLTIASSLGYSRGVVLGLWLLLVVSGFLLTVRLRSRKESTGFDISWWWLWVLCAATALWSILPAIQCYPFVKEGGLYVNVEVFDHVKMAFSDAMVREGLPPVNPFYSANGETQTLSYFYLWQFMASHVRLMLGVSSWCAEVSMSWFTAFSGMTLLCALTLMSSRRVLAGFLVLLLASALSSLDLVSFAFGARADSLFYKTNGFHGLVSLLTHLAWAAQHVFSAFAVVLLIYVLIQLVLNRANWWKAGLVLGCIASVAVSTSVWIGGVALSLTLPFLLLVLVFLRVSKRTWWCLAKCGLLAIPVCVVLVLPVLQVMVGQTDEKFPVAACFFFNELIAGAPFVNQILHYILFWVYYLPLVLGAPYVLGLFSLLVLRAQTEYERIFRAVSLVFILVYLFTVQFLRSTIANNDLGWRSVIVPALLLLVWSASGMARIIHWDSDGVQREPRRFQIRAWRGWIMFVSGGLWSLGIVWTISLLMYSNLFRPIHAANPEMRKDFLAHKDAWDRLKTLTDPHDIVQSNPDGFAEMTTWPCNLGWVAFSDRKISFSTKEHAFVYARGSSQSERDEHYAILTNVFSSTPERSYIPLLDEKYNIEALLITRRDGAFTADAIENSGYYSVAHQDETSKLLLRTRKTTAETVTE